MKRVAVIAVAVVLLSLVAPSSALSSSSQQKAHEPKPKTKKRTIGEKIKHIVVLMEENRSFDHVLGWFGKGTNGLNGSQYNLVNVSDPTSKKVYVTKKAPYINLCDPDHSTPSTTYKVFGPQQAASGDLTNPTMEGFVMQEKDFPLGGHTSDPRYCNVMDMFETATKLPVLNKLAEEFLVMDRLFASVPGPTWPNRQFFLSATSSGLTETFLWYENNTGVLYPQKTIFDQVAERNASWKVYYEDTPWELFMESLAHNPEHLHSLDQFYADCKTGDLPLFSFINPRSGINVTTGEGSNDEHPDHDVALAEAHYKKIYEAIRHSPAWNETLFVLTYDEHGGFYDHVPTPLGAAPPLVGQRSYPDDFRFDRLGVRIPTLLISPWIPKGSVLSGPPAAQKPFNNSEYDLTSIMASARKILEPLHGLPPLTGRDAWVATWENVLETLDEPRTDCPEELPMPPPPTLPPQEEALQTINGLQTEIMTFHAALHGESFPHHLRIQGEVSEWMQSKFLHHKEVTRQWKNSKSASPKVGLQPLVQPMKQPDPSQQWLLSRHWRANQTVDAKMTFSLTWNDTLMCLDGAGMTNGSVLTVSKCYPNPDPSTNRDKDQQWVLHEDASLRPYNGDRDLCVTNNYFPQQSDHRLILAPCIEGDVTQHYAYHGRGGNGIPGLLVFGDGLMMFTVY